MTMTPLACVFPGAATALEIARLLSGNPDVETLPPDGWLTDPGTGTSVYYNIAPIGPLTDAEGNPILCASTGAPGWCLIGLWHAPPETVPAALRPYMVEPETFPVRYG